MLMSEENAAGTPKKIVWLASYPKSGNTWFRAFITALLGNGDLDINEMKTDGIFSSREIFNGITDLDSTLMYDEEIKVLQPQVFNELAKSYTKEKLFVKIHDAYIYNVEDKPIVPAESSYCAVYFIRNPLDVVPSMSGHGGGSIEHAIKQLNKENAALAKQKNNLNRDSQLRQFMKSWSGHVESWESVTDFPVLMMRYEDMLHNTQETFSKAVAFMGLSYDEAAIAAAIKASSFESLKKQESEKKFRETVRPGQTFFRKGGTGSWKTELTDEQVTEVVNAHRTVMARYGYLTHEEAGT
jgi:hypothetical protein